MYLQTGTRQLPLDEPVVMGILNVTPDSFSDGGRFVDHESALRQAELMISEGAAIVDIGGESTRPGASAVSSQEEIDRVVPMVESIRRQSDVVVSVDTSKPEVMTAAVEAGASMINDVRALLLEDALQVAAALDVAVCLMHMKGTPGTMQEQPDYDDVVREVTSFLGDRVRDCLDAGVSRERICVDPGFGFGKNDRHNMALLRELGHLQTLECPVAVGISRKHTLGKITGKCVDERMPAGIAAAVLAMVNGATIVRTHDVGATVDAAKLVSAARRAE